MNHTRTVREWANYLNESEWDELIDYTGAELKDKLSANEVLDAIVSYEGGVATGYEIRSLISRIYAIGLD